MSKHDRSLLYLTLFFSMVILLVVGVVVLHAIESWEFKDQCRGQGGYVIGGSEDVCVSQDGKVIDTR